MTPPPLILQALPPAAARLCLTVERFCVRDVSLPRGAALLLALSGGADSTALALILCLLAPRLNLRLHALSVDHGLRPEAAADAAHARDTARRLGLPCQIRRTDASGLAAREGRGIEDAARRLRYALLEAERQACRADFIVLGHHAGDLSEDVLLRLVRGAGWPALGGMPARDDARHLLRPLLHTDPASLRDLLRCCGLTWREDASNHDDHYRRNRLRHHALPLLRAENPSLDRTLRDLWQLAQQDADYWRAQMDVALATFPWQEAETAAGRSLYLPPDLLRPLHPTVRLRLYLRAVRRLCAPDVNSADGPGHDTVGAAALSCAAALPTDAPSGAQARARTLLALDTALTQGRGQTIFQLPGGVSARVIKGGILFSAPGASLPAANSTPPK